MTYVLLVREATIGSGEKDALFLRHEGVVPGHARLFLRARKLGIAGLREDAPVEVSGHGRIAPGTLVELEPACTVLLGTARLRYSLATDDDMKP